MIGGVIAMVMTDQPLCWQSQNRSGAVVLTLTVDLLGVSEQRRTSLIDHDLLSISLIP